MKRVAWVFSAMLMILLASCDTGSDAKEAEQVPADIVEAAAKRVANKLKKAVDTTFAGISSSVKAEADSTAHKVKEQAKILGETARQKANEEAEKLKESAQKIKEAAKSGVDAAKDEFKK